MTRYCMTTPTLTQPNRVINAHEGTRRLLRQLTGCHTLIGRTGRGTFDSHPHRPAVDLVSRRHTSGTVGVEQRRHWTGQLPSVVVGQQPRQRSSMKGVSGAVEVPQAAAAEVLRSRDLRSPAAPDTRRNPTPGRPDPRPSNRSQNLTETVGRVFHRLVMMYE